MNKFFSIIGGDLRIVKLASMLANDKNTVKAYAMEKSKEIMENTQIEKCKSLDEAIDTSDIIISSIPFLKGNKEVFSAFSDNHIFLEDLVKNQHKNKTFIAGSISKEDENTLLNSFGKVFDIMKNEELTILNTIATAEGTIEVAINNTDKILQGCKVLVLGFGRVGKVVSMKFKALSTEVTCAARKSADLAYIKAFGYNAQDINLLDKNLSEYDIIINTVPKIIIEEIQMQYMKKDVLLIDLASNPGGINREDAKKLNLKLIWALALPGKIAPVTSAEFIKNTILAYT